MKTKLLLPLLAALAVACAQAATLDFEDLVTGGPGGAGQVIGVCNQYANQEITFNCPSAFDYSIGSLAIPGFAHSGVKAMEPCYGQEFCGTPVEMNFVGRQRRVKVWVGFSARLFQAQIVILRAFDGAGVQVGQATANFASSAGPIPIRTPLEVNGAGIRRATVAFVGSELPGGAVVNNHLAVDDVEFDPDTGLADFGLTASVVSLSVPPGNSASFQAVITRTNGSLGPIQFSINGLPSGVTASFSANPANTNPIVTLTAAGNAPLTGTAGQTVTITGTPSSPSVGPAPRQATLAVIVQSDSAVSRTGFTLSSVDYANGRFELRINGPTNRVYRVEASADLDDWTILATNVTGGRLEIVDPNAGAFRHRYYRGSASPETHALGEDVLALQGLWGNTLVAGKTTAFRFFTDELTYSAANRIETAILRPDGSRLARSWTRPDFAAVPNSTRGRSLVVRVPGRDLPWVGGYYLEAKVFDGHGGLLASYSLDQTRFLPTKDLRVMVDRLWSGTATKPGEIEAAHAAMQRMAALFPVRDGVSTLDGDRTAGLRYLVNDNPSGPPNQDAHVCPLFASWLNRPLSVDSIDVGLTYRFSNDGEGCGGNANHACPGQNLGWSVIVWQARLHQVFSHECGHNLGLVPPQDPHWDGGVHSKDLTIDSLEADMGFDLQFNQPFPNPTYDVMYPTGQCPGYEASLISLSSWDWEYLRQRLVQLPSTGPTASPNVTPILTQVFPMLAGPSRRELVGVGADGLAWHIAEGVPGGEFGPVWLRLGSAVGIKEMTVGRNADGRLEAFAVDGNPGVWHVWQTDAATGQWGEWEPIWGADLKHIALANNRDGRFELFGLGRDGSVWHIWQTTPNGNWGDWRRLGGAVGLTNLTVGANADGRLEVFGLDPNPGVWHVWQTMPNGGWGEWEPIWGADVREIKVANNQDGRLELFGLTREGTVAHIWQTTPNGNWGNWYRLGEAAGLKNMTVGRNADGRLQVFAVDPNPGVWHASQSSPNGGWNDWVPWWEPTLKRIVVGTNPDGRLELFGLDDNLGAWHAWQTAPNGGWSHWAWILGR